MICRSDEKYGNFEIKVVLFLWCEKRVNSEGKHVSETEYKSERLIHTHPRDTYSSKAVLIRTYFGALVAWTEPFMDP